MNSKRLYTKVPSGNSCFYRSACLCFKAKGDISGAEPLKKEELSVGGMFFVNMLLKLLNCD